MEYSSFLAYFTALAALTAAPGPVVAVLVARSLGRDSGGASAFAFGLCVGDVLAVCAVALGIGVWTENQPQWFSAAKYAGVAYLLWLSLKMWNDNARLAPERLRKASWLGSAGAGIVLCLGNPSTIFIYMLLLPTVAPGGIDGIEQLSMILLVTFVAVGAVFFGAILLAQQANRIIASPESSSRFSRTMAAIVAITAIWILVA